MPFLLRVRSALLILLLPRLVAWTADALSEFQEDPDVLLEMNLWQLAHLDEAAGCAARVWDCWAYLSGEGPRVVSFEKMPVDLTK